MATEFEPVLTKGIIFCDGVIREEVTRKNSYIGTFQVYNLPNFPYQIPPFYVTPFITNFASDVRNFEITVRVENPSNSMVLASNAVKIALSKTPERNEAIEVPVPIFNLAFQGPGQYRVAILVNNEMVGERTLFVNDVRASATQK